MGRGKLTSFIIAALLLVLTTSGISNSHTLCEGFLPPNDMKIPVGGRHLGIRNNGGINETEYNKIMDRIQLLYTDVIKQRGGNLVINRMWSTSEVNSSAEQRGRDWIINMYGGIARHPDVTYEGEALVACHEIGHHIGGAPKISSFFGGSWATNEGGADYFATLKCLRKFFAEDDNASIVARATIDPLVRSQCQAQFSNVADQDICMRISMGAESISYLFQDLRKEPTRPKFSTPDATQVAKTNDEHPQTQCRMDTYFNGSLCPVAASTPNSETDFKVGSCVQGVDSIGFRPRCWFSPDSSGGGGGGGGGGGEGSCPLGDDELCKQICEYEPSLPFCKTVLY